MTRVEPQPPDRVEPLSEDALETSKLIVELIHAVQATRDATAPVGRGHGAAVGPSDTGRPRTVSPHAIRASIHLYQHGARTIGELASGLGISIGWASRIVSELEASGLVSRTADMADRRVVRVALADEAVTIVESAYRWRGDAIERALAGLDNDGRLAVRTFLRRAIEELESDARA